MTKHTWLPAVLAASLFLTPFANASWTQHTGAESMNIEWGHTARTDNYGLPQDGISTVPLTQTQLTAIQETLASRDLVLIIGGLGSLRGIDGVTAFMNNLASTNASPWKTAVSELTTALAPLQGAHSIYLQLGNEINSAVASQTLHTWAQDGVLGGTNDLSTIPWLVEYYIAPSIAAINEANASQPTPIQIALGSTANFGNPAAQAWLDALLTYVIQGTFAPELTGKRVADVIDTATFHYLAGTTDSAWEPALDHLADTWLRTGVFTGLFATEEGGRRQGEAGNGAATALRVFSHYTAWASQSGFNGNRLRYLFWGQSLGPATTRVADAMQTILNFTGEANLTLVTGTPVVTTDYELYQFKVVGQSKFLITILPKTTTTLTTLPVPLLHTTGTATAHLFKATGSETPATVIEKNTLNFSMPLEVTKDTALLITITR